MQSSLRFVNYFKFSQAMAKDKKNIWQETPNQLRQKVTKFISIPEHFAEYCKPRGMLIDDEEKQSVAI